MIFPSLLVMLFTSFAASESYWPHNFGVSSNAERNSRFARATKETTGGLSRLCLDNGPDGMVLLRDSDDAQDVVLFFKTKSYFPSNLKQLEGFLLKQGKIDVLSNLNEYDLTEWNQFPVSPKYVVSPTGLNKNDTFYNNVFAFKDLTLYRYRITKLTLAQANQSIVFDIKHELVGTYTIEYWHHFVSLDEVDSIFMPRETKIMAVRVGQPIGAITMAYLLVDSNIENPIETTLTSEPTKHLNTIEALMKVKYLYELNDQDDVFYLTKDGMLCLNEKCKQLRSAVECPAAIQTFTEGSLFWIWTKTDLTIRLLAVGLSSIMVVDFILALAFIYNQVKRVMDLT